MAHGDGGASGRRERRERYSRPRSSCWPRSPAPVSTSTRTSGAARPAGRVLRLAAGGDPARGLDLAGPAVTSLADELRTAERQLELETGVRRLAMQASGLPHVSEALHGLMHAPDIAWNAYAASLLADELDEDWTWTRTPTSSPTSSRSPSCSLIAIAAAPLAARVGLPGPAAFLGVGIVAGATDLIPTEDLGLAAPRADRDRRALRDPLPGRYLDRRACVPAEPCRRPSCWPCRAPPPPLRPWPRSATTRSGSTGRSPRSWRRARADRPSGGVRRAAPERRRGHPRADDPRGGVRVQRPRRDLADGRRRSRTSARTPRGSAAGSSASRRSSGSAASSGSRPACS